MTPEGEVLRALLQERLQRFEVQSLPAEGRKHAAVAVVVTEAGWGAGLPGLPLRPAQGCHLAPHADMGASEGAADAWSTAPALLLTRRAEGLRQHAGQWALPGGRIDAGETPEAAALRELHEEVGLVLPPGAVLGRLDDYATRSGYLITPVVVWAGAARELQPNPAEVASVHRIGADELLRADAPILNHVRGAPHPVLRMPVGTAWIAAPTAVFMYQFRELALCGRATRVAHFDQPVFAWR